MFIVDKQSFITGLQIIKLCIQLPVIAQFFREQRIYNKAIFVIQPYGIAPIFQHKAQLFDLGCILRSESGERFRRYVRRGLSFVEAYTLAARDRLNDIREGRAREAARVKAASKDHLNATSSTGLGALPVPGDEMALFRELMPDAAEAEIRRYYNADRKRFGRKEKGVTIS